MRDRRRRHDPSVSARASIDRRRREVEVANEFRARFRSSKINTNYSSVGARKLSCEVDIAKEFRARVRANFRTELNSNDYRSATSP